MRFDKLRPKSSSTDWRAQQDFKIAAAPLLDLMELSGYARLMADYHGNDQLWEIVTREWDKYIAERKEESPLPLLLTAISLTESSFEIPHRGTHRTNWKMNIDHQLDSVPRHEVYSSNSFGSDIEIEHPSPLIRIFAGAPYGSSYDGIDIFITFYLAKKDRVKELDFGWKRRNLQESLDRESSKRDCESTTEEVR